MNVYCLLLYQPTLYINFIAYWRIHLWGNHRFISNDNWCWCLSDYSVYCVFRLNYNIYINSTLFYNEIFCFCFWYFFTLSDILELLNRHINGKTTCKSIYLILKISKFYYYIGIVLIFIGIILFSNKKVKYSKEEELNELEAEEIIYGDMKTNQVNVINNQ